MGAPCVSCPVASEQTARSADERAALGPLPAH
jgi:hypothetical protein